MGERHAQRVERAFSGQAAAFEDPRFNRLFTTDSEWLFERLALTRDDLVLDVAAGTGHVARQLAPSVRAVVAVDATVAMLEQGRAQGVPNVRLDGRALDHLGGQPKGHRLVGPHRARGEHDVLDPRLAQQGGEPGVVLHRQAVADGASDREPELGLRGAD